jgi:glycerophosphoryl diester phosphodiesterase
MNCIGSECDVWLTKDDSLVVEHDIRYAGKNVEKSTYAELARTKLSNGETLPTLRQFLTVVAGQDQTKLFIELKAMNYSENWRNRVVDRVLKLVKEMQMEDHVVYCSFIFYFLERIQELEPSATTLFLGGTLAPANIRTAGISGISYDIDTLEVHTDWPGLTKANDLILSSWTINDEDQFAWLLNHNVDYTLTDVPNTLFRRMVTMQP